MAILTEIAGPVGRIILDRPRRANAYDRQHLDAIGSSLASLEAECRVIVITSTGAGAFCGGADLAELATASPLSALDLRSQQVFNQLAASRCVTIAAVHGPAVAGGCELALACDVRVVGPAAAFRLPETALGLLPAAGGTTRLTRLLGAARAKQVILLGDTISAQQALDWGLAARLEDAPRAAAMALAATVAERDPTALRLAKLLIDADESRASLMAERIAEALLYSQRD
jgi:enoyl-CoA hydratase